MVQSTIHLSICVRSHDSKNNRKLCWNSTFNQWLYKKNGWDSCQPHSLFSFFKINYSCQTISISYRTCIMVNKTMWKFSIIITVVISLLSAFTKHVPRQVKSNTQIQCQTCVLCLFKLLKIKSVPDLINLYLIPRQESG